MPIRKKTLLETAMLMQREELDPEPGTPTAHKPKERSLLLIGSKGVGKTSLIYRFLDRSEHPRQTLALEYIFGRKVRRNLIKDVCHIWELGGGTLYPSLLATPIAASAKNLKNLTVILMLDLSTPQHLWYTMETLIQELLLALRKLAGKHSGELMEELQAAAWDRVGRDNPDREFMDPFPVSLVILGGKHDVYQNFDPEKKKVVCRCLRYVAHTLGATLQFYSLWEAGLIKKGVDLLKHICFDGPPVKGISQDYNKPLLIPAGSDSMQKIGGYATSRPAVGKGPGAALERWKHTFTTHFPQEASERTVMPEDPAKDVSFREPAIDALRSQKDDELERYRQEDKKIPRRRRRVLFDEFS